MPPVLGNTANWNFVYNKTYIQRYDLPTTHPDFAYIGEIVIPLIFTSPYLTVQVTSYTAKPTWKSAGYCKQQVQVGISTGGLVDAFINERHLLSLYQPTLVTFNPDVASSYALWFRPFNWFEDVSITIHEYVGTV